MGLTDERSRGIPLTVRISPRNKSPPIAKTRRSFPPQDRLTQWQAGPVRAGGGKRRDMGREADKDTASGVVSCCPAADGYMLGRSRWAIASRVNVARKGFPQSMQQRFSEA